MTDYVDGLMSERLITRKLRATDVDIWKEFFYDKEVIAYLPTTNDSSDYERSKEWIERQIQRYKHNDYGLQALLDKNTNRFVGQCGLLNQEVKGCKELEIGYHILKKFWGQGFAPEAAGLFIDYAFTNNLSNSIISIIDVRNVNSKRVAEKNGLERESKTVWKNLEVEIFRITKEKWAWRRLNNHQ